jgi:hypothetical protein
VLYCTFSSFHVASVILTPRLVGNIFSWCADIFVYTGY